MFIFVKGSELDCKNTDSLENIQYAVYFMFGIGGYFSNENLVMKAFFYN
jgi:hypothetical protein